MIIALDHARSRENTSRSATLLRAALRSLQRRHGQNVKPSASLEL